MFNLITYPCQAKRSTENGKNMRVLKKGAYMHLGMTKTGNLSIYFDFRQGNTLLRLVPAKGYVMDALLHALLIRPIRMPPRPFTWYHKELNNLRTYPIENVAPEFVDEYYTLAQRELLALLGCNITDEQRLQAHTQLIKITTRQQAISNSITAFDAIAFARKVGGLYDFYDD